MVNRQAFNSIQVHAVIAVIQHGNQAVFDALFKRNGMNAMEQIHLLNACCHAIRDITGNLAAITPVCLVAIVFFWIVAGGNVDAGCGMEFTD